MSAAAIHCDALSKRYLLGEREKYRTLRESIMRSATRALSALRRERDAGAAEVWALRDVSLEVKVGEVVGVIGRNGAGKTTLLKILSRITRPTSGRATVRGRVGAMLEVGTGFHPELTGRENIFLNGAILGMKRSDIARRFDEIVAFAGVERFLDTPIKRYSTGMYMRLAFAVAAHLEPEILLVDEVLAVGDAAFQKKCLGKMNDAAVAGRTAVFVSHNLLAVRDLCTRAVWIDAGQVMASGETASVVARYLATVSAGIPERRWKDAASAPGTDYVRLSRAAAAPCGGSPGDEITVRTPISIEVDYWKLGSGYFPGLSLQLYNEHGILVFETGRPRDPLGRKGDYPAGLYSDSCTIPGDLLNDGAYRIVLYIQGASGAVTHIEHDVIAFEIRDVTELRDGWYGHWRGAVRPPVEWTTRLAAEELPHAAACE